MDAIIKIATFMREFDIIFSVRPQEPEYFLPTRFAGLATLVTSARGTCGRDHLLVSHLFSTCPCFNKSGRLLHIKGLNTYIHRPP